MLEATLPVHSSDEKLAQEMTSFLKEKYDRFVSISFASPTDTPLLIFPAANAFRHENESRKMVKDCKTKSCYIQHPHFPCRIALIYYYLQ